VRKSGFGLIELWHYRHLLYYFVWRELKIRYRQTFLGVLWTILQPTLMALLIYAILSKGLNTGPQGWQGALFYYCGMIVWQLFSQTVNLATNAVIQQAPIVRKIYFPRLILPCSSALLASADFLIHATLLCILMIFNHNTASDFPKLLASLPVVYIVTILVATGTGSWLSALNVTYRDVRYALPFFIQCLFFLTPVLYINSALQNNLLMYIIDLNPLSWCIQRLRSSIMPSEIEEYWFASFAIPGLLSLLIFLAGLRIFHSRERKFADML
jgi:lipopolysaccharide transport system permease protein